MGRVLTVFPRPGRTESERVELMDFIGFLVLATLLVAIPGPAVTLVMKQSVMRGPSAAMATAIGVFVADLIWVAASVAGITAVVVASEPVFQAIRILGAIYLCWLGLTLLASRRRLGPSHGSAAAGKRSFSVSPFAEGLLCDLSNPKTLLVFTSVIPQFLPHGGGHPLHAITLGVTFALLGLASLAIYAVILGRLGRAGRESRLGGFMLRASGAVLVVFGLRLAFEDPAR